MPSSGIGGPCDHCGRTQSCCWRRGPAAKPTLCNACGSRYLVKKNLDGYVPLIQRQGGAPRSPKSKTRTKPVTLARPAGVSDKPKRTAAKRVESWASDVYDESDESSELYLSDHSGGRSHSMEATHVPFPAISAGGHDLDLPRAPKRSILGDANRAKVMRITTETQLQALGPELLDRILSTSLRMKPRKPLRPSITAVF